MPDTLHIPSRHSLSCFWLLVYIGARFFHSLLKCVLTSLNQRHRGGKSAYNAVFVFKNRNRSLQGSEKAMREPHGGVLGLLQEGLTISLLEKVRSW